MIRTQKEVANLLRGVLESDLDSFLGEHGFSRQQNSLEYTRKIKNGTQTLRMHFDLNPTYEPNAAAHLLPQLVVSLDELNNAVSEMFGGDISLVGTTDLTFVQQLQNAAPHQQRFVNWLVFDRKTAYSCIASIRDFIRAWTIPFLNEYSTIEAIARGYERKDERLQKDRRLVLFIAAALVLLGQPAKAMQVLEETFRRPGVRKQYARAFEFVARQLEKKS